DGGHPIERHHVVRLMPAEEGLDALSKALVVAAGAEDVGLPLARGVELQGLHEDRSLSHGRFPSPKIERARLTLILCECRGGHRPGTGIISRDPARRASPR